MEPLPKSGLYYPNNLARIAFLALEDVMGSNGVNALLSLANKREYIGNYPPDNMENQIDFSDISTVIGTLDDMYGLRGSRVLAMRTGMAVFDETLKNIGEAVDVNDEGFLALPLIEKMRVGLSFVGISLTQSTKNVPIMKEESDHFSYAFQLCPVCWGRKTTDPSCHLLAGTLRGGLKWVTRGLNFNVTQVKAHSCGDDVCEFVIPFEPV